MNDELYHWKYKRRYKGSNGKWVYVYDEKQHIKSEFKVGFKDGMRALGSKISSDFDKAGDKASELGKKAAKEVSDTGKRVAKAVSNWSDKTVDNIKKESGKAIDKAEKWLNSKTIIDTTRTTRTSKNVVTDSSTGESKIVQTKNVTITDGELTKSVNKAKGWIARNLFGRKKKRVSNR